MRALITLVVSGCISGIGSGLTGVIQEGGGNVRSLVFSVQPSNADSGDFITPAIQVAALDSAGAVDTSFTGQVTVTLATNPTGATLHGTTSTTAVAGIATFGDLWIDRPGTYTLRASGGGASVTSNAFTITRPPPPLP